MSALAGLLAAAAVLLWPAATAPAAAWLHAAKATGGPRWSLRSPWSPGAWRSRLTARRRGTAFETPDVLGLVDLVAPALGAGLAPEAALRLLAVTVDGPPGRPTVGSPAPACPSVRRLAEELARCAARGEPLAPRWAYAAETSGSAELDLLARAWALTEDTGAPLARAAATVASLVRHRVAVQRRLEVAVAGARASMNLLTVLPLAGPLAGLALGIGPLQLYAGPAARASLCAGLALAVAGRVWVRRIVRAVTRSEAVA